MRKTTKRSTERFVSDVYFPYFGEFLWTSVNDVRTYFVKQKQEEQKKEFDLKDDPEDLDSDLPNDSSIAA